LIFRSRIEQVDFVGLVLCYPLINDYNFAWIFAFLDRFVQGFAS